MCVTYIRNLSLATAFLFCVSIPSVSSAHFIFSDVTLNGPSETPPFGSPGTGSGSVELDLDLITMRVLFSFSGLTGNTTGAHIHAATAAPFTGTAPNATPSLFSFPLNVTSGTYDQTFDLSLANSYDPTFLGNGPFAISDALNALSLAIEEGKAYITVETTAFPNGEIRGFLVPVPETVPEPSSAMLLSIATFAVAGIRRRVR